MGSLTTHIKEHNARMKQKHIKKTNKRTSYDARNKQQRKHRNDTKEHNQTQRRTTMKQEKNTTTNNKNNNRDSKKKHTMIMASSLLCALFTLFRYRSHRRFPVPLSLQVYIPESAQAAGGSKGSLQGQNERGRVREGEKDYQLRLRPPTQVTHKNTVLFTRAAKTHSVLLSHLHNLL